MKKHPVYLVTFPGGYLAAATFLRFQEHYESASPRFRDGPFTWEEFMDWQAKERGKFDYLTEWDAFNVPSGVLRPFRRGDFDPLTAKERALLDLVKDVPEPFYLVGAVEGDDGNVAHELAHGLFSVDATYSAAVLKVLERFPCRRLRARLAAMGYAGHVIDDEINAYVLTGLCHELYGSVPKGLRAALRGSFTERFGLDIGKRSDLRRLLRQVHRLKFRPPSSR